MTCGTALDGSGQAAPHAAPSTAEERRTVTVLFADLSGSTSVAERLDPEVVKRLIDRCLRRLSEEVDRFGGAVDKFIGDAVMATFGAPVAHEDDPERAVRAGLAMQSAMDELNARLTADHGLKFALRVGINTGEVLAGRVGDSYTVIGDAVNVASRLQTAGAPGWVTVGERTQRATSAAIDYHELEPLEVKGKAEPVPAWRAITAHGIAERARREAPLVGRAEELAQLERLYRRVADGSDPHLVTVTGQPGVGKTRLMREFERWLIEEGDVQRVLRGRCPPFGATVVYWPLVEILREECGIVDGDPADVAWSKLSGRLGPLLRSDPHRGEGVTRRLAPLARLLGAEIPSDADGTGQDDAQSAREAFFGSVKTCIEAIGADKPLVLCWEDIHWADEGTLDLIDYLSQWLRAPVLQLCLAREDLLVRRPTWGAPRRGASTLFLDALPAEETRKLIGGLLREAGATDQLLEALVERAGGNPLFAEEMVQRISEEGGARASELPDTVRGVLAARIDALEPFERALVAHAAVIGRTFWEGALVPVAVAERGDLNAALEQLRRKDIIVPGESADLAGEQELAFKHVLIRDVAYAMLPKAARARKHRDVGELIEQRAGERGEEVVALLAEHYGRAAAFGGEVGLEHEELGPIRAKALQFIEAAGDAARDLYSNQEALAHYAAAAELTADDPVRSASLHEKQGDVALRLGRVDSAIEAWQQCIPFWEADAEPERVAELHRKTGAALAHKGERAQAIEHHQRGINLLKDAPPSLTLVRLYEEAASLYMQVGDNMLAIYAAEKALRLAEQLGELAAASRAHGIFGRVFGRIGDTSKARENLERAITLARDTDDSETVLAMLALGYHLENGEGDYPAAGRAYAEALSLAQRIGDVPAQIELYAALAQLAFYRCDWGEVERASDASAELAEREGLIGKLCLPYTLRALLRWREGELESSAQLFRHARELAQKLGWSEVAFNALLGLAVTLRDRGEPEEARAVLAEALELCDRGGLIAQSLQATAAETVLLALAGESEQAKEAAAKATALAERVRYPIGEAAALEARGATGDGADELLTQAAAAWEELGRPLDAARCKLLIGQLLRDTNPAGANDALDAAATAYAELGVEHLAERARALVAA